MVKAPPLKKQVPKIPEKKDNKKEFLVSDNFGNFFCGYSEGHLFWSDKISQARELVFDGKMDIVSLRKNTYKFLIKNSIINGKSFYSTH